MEVNVPVWAQQILPTEHDKPDTPAIINDCNTGMVFRRSWNERQTQPIKFSRWRPESDRTTADDRMASNIQWKIWYWVCSISRMLLFTAAILRRWKTIPQREKLADKCDKCIWSRRFLLWSTRNQDAHGETEHIRQRLEHESTMREVRELHDAKNQMEPRVQELLPREASDHVSQSRRVNAHWLRIHGPTMRESMKGREIWPSKEHDLYELISHQSNDWGVAMPGTVAQRCLLKITSGHVGWFLIFRTMQQHVN